jgi:hypothetical protein
MSTLKDGYFGLQNSTVSLGRRGKYFLVNFKRYEIANNEE